MRHTLRFALTMAFLSSVLASLAQVTKLSNNTNIRSKLINGIGLASLGVMYDDKGSLWKTDGTPEGTSKYTNKVVLDSNKEMLQTAFNNKIYFVGTTAANGSELWVTDGTDAGTAMVKDINPGVTGSTPSNFVLFNNVIYFFATTATYGRELWRSDGTNAGTFMVKDINPTGDCSIFSDPALFGPGVGFFANNNILFFTADDGTHGTELWKTDGTEAGTVMVKDINPDSGYSNPQNFGAFGTNIFFSADDGIHGEELWKSDGSGKGTVLVKDIVSGSESSSPGDFFLFGNKLFFIALSNGYWNQIWSTDGSGGGTSLVADFGFLYSLNLSSAVIFGNKFLFNPYQTFFGTEIWISDGTSAGTSFFKDFWPGGLNEQDDLWPDIYGAISSGSANWHSRLFNGKIFLSVDDGTHGDELWISDGTVNNTAMVKDINPGSGSSLDMFSGVLPFYTQSGMYFPADDGTHGVELWKSDGTGYGTSMVKDINPNGNSFSDFVMFFNGHIYFTADDGDNSNGDVDLYVIDEAVTLPLTLADFTAAFDGKAVQLQWTTSTEINTKNFIIQRSIDGIHFTSIGTVNAVGNGTEKTAYQFADAGAVNAGANKLYYRLQMVDKDGKFTYSKIAIVEIRDDKLFVIYPNPAKDQLLITSNRTLNNPQIRISDQRGNVIYQQQIANMQAGTPNKINVSGFSKGVYYLQFISGGDVQIMKFFKD